MIPFLFPFSRGLLFPLVALDKIYTVWIANTDSLVFGFYAIFVEAIVLSDLILSKY